MDEYEKTGTNNVAMKSREPWDIYVSQGCRFRHVIAHCLQTLKSSKKIILTGIGAQINKTISIAEIVKRKQKNLLQDTEIKYTDVEDQWEPKDKSKGLDGLKVTRHTPTITITLSLDECNDKKSNEDDLVNENEEIELENNLMVSLREILKSKHHSEKPKKQNKRKKDTT